MFIYIYKKYIFYFVFFYKNFDFLLEIKYICNNELSK